MLTSESVCVDLFTVTSNFQYHWVSQLFIMYFYQNKWQAFFIKQQLWKECVSIFSPSVSLTIFSQIWNISMLVLIVFQLWRVCMDLADWKNWIFAGISWHASGMTWMFCVNTPQLYSAWTHGIIHGTGYESPYITLHYLPTVVAAVALLHTGGAYHHTCSHLNVKCTMCFSISAYVWWFSVG